MSKINELPTLERPREKAFHYGINSLSNIELLAILIGSGTKDRSAMDLAYELINRYKGLFSLYNAPYQDFKKIKGMKEAKTIKLAAAFELAKRYEIIKEDNKNELVDSHFIYRKVAPQLVGQTRENFILIICNRKREIIHEETLYLGAENNVPFSFKDVLCTLLMYHAYSFYMVHNHPNGDVSPSEKDINLTEKIIKETSKLGIHLIDHIIVSEFGYFSFLEKEKHLKDVQK